MNKQIQRLGIVLVVCYLAVFVKVHQTQLLQVDELAAREDNQRPVLNRLSLPRGKIVSADGALLAESLDVGDATTPRRRMYPEGELFGHVTGYFSRVYVFDGVEKSYNNELSEAPLDLGGLADLFTVQENVGHVTVTVRKDLQELARTQIGPDRQGSVVVLDPRNGDILAFWSNPSYNPQTITEGFGDGKTPGPAQAAWAALNKTPGKPLLANQYREIYLPGSTMKVVTAGVGLESGKVTDLAPVYPTETFYRPPLTGSNINNFNSSACGGTLPQIMTVSCNSGFMRMGVETIGGPGMAAGTKAWGFNVDVPIDLPRPARSKAPEDFTADPGRLAQTSIGQQDVAATPLQMAMVAGAAANGGVMMKPHVMKEIRNSNAEVVKTWEPSPWLTPLSKANAQVLANDLLGPVNNPNGSAAGRIKLPPGFIAGGKTGTAQTGPNRGDPLHTWFMGFAGPVGQPPTVAIAVVVLNQPNNGEATGGQVAAPVANAMLNKALEVVDLPDSDVTPLLATTTTTVLPPGATTPTTQRQR